MDGSAKINKNFFPRKPPAGTSKGSRDPIILLALFRHMEMLISMNINFFKFE